LSALYCRLASPSPEEVLSTVPCLIDLIVETNSTAAYTALCRLTELGDEVMDRLLSEGYLQQIFHILLECPDRFQEEAISDFLCNLFLASDSALPAILGSGFLEVLLATGHLGQSLEGALNRSPEVLDRVIGLSLVRELILTDHAGCFSAIASCTAHATEPRHLHSLVEQGVLLFFSCCLQHSREVGRTLRAIRELLRAEPRLASRVRREVGEGVARWRGDRSWDKDEREVVPQLAEEVWELLADI
jgi:hypothetical protein